MMSIIELIVFLVITIYFTSSILFLLVIKIQNRLSSFLSKKNVKHYTDKMFYTKKESIYLNIAVKPDNKELNKLNIKKDVVIVIDCSPSMSGEPIKNAVWGALEFIKAAKISEDNVNISVVTFSSTSNMLLKLSHKKRQINKAVSDIETDMGWTNIYSGLEMACDILEKSNRHGDEDCEKAIVLITDGYENEDDTLKIMPRLQRLNITNYVIGTGDANLELLYKLSEVNDNGKHFYSTDTKDFIQFFMDIQESIESFNVYDVYVTNKRYEKDFSYIGTSSGHKVLTVSPAKWYIPVLSNEGERIVQRLFPKQCIGLFDASGYNTSVKYIGNDDESHEFEENKISAKVIVMPWYPAVFWAVLINPVLWALIRKSFCRTRAILEEKPIAIELEPQPSLAIPEYKEVNEYQIMPSVYIGLGTLGTEIISAVKSLLTDNISIDKLPERCKFLSIDTEEYNASERAFGNASLSEREVITIGSDVHDYITGNTSNYIEKSLLHTLDKEAFDTLKGASGIRLLGQISYKKYIKENSGALESKIEELVQFLAELNESDHSPQINIVVSDCGGTGSAIFEDIHALIADTLTKKGLKDVRLNLIISRFSSKISDKYSYSQQGMNSSAFYLEIERIKSASKISLSVQSRNINRSMDYIFSSGFDPAEAKESVLKTAALVFTLSAASKDYIGKLDYSLSGIDKSEMGIVNTTSNVSCIPVALIKEYCSNRVLLSMGEELIGCIHDSGRIMLAGSTESEIRNSLQHLFSATPTVESDIIYNLPDLFRHILYLADAETNIIDLLCACLEEIPEFADEFYINENIKKAFVYTVKWMDQILADNKNAGVALILNSLITADEIVNQALAKAAQSSITDLNADSLALFTKERMSRFTDLMEAYQNMFRALINNIMPWSYAFMEGFPYNYTSSSVRSFPKSAGVLRKLRRANDLIEQKAKDYGFSDFASYTEKLYQKLSDDFNSIRSDMLNNIKWHFDIDTINENIQRDGTSFINNSYLELVVNMTDGTSDRIKCSDQMIQQVEKSFEKICNIWMKTKNFDFGKTDEIRAYDTPTRESQYFEYNSTEDSAFRNQLFTKINLITSYSESYRDSAYMRSLLSQDSFRLGKRYHVRQEDIFCAMLQRIAHENNRHMDFQFSSTALLLLNKFENFQKFIYFVAADSISIDTYPGTLEKCLVLKIGVRSYILTRPGDTSLYSAAIEYIYNGACLESGNHVDDSIFKYDRTLLTQALDTRMNDFLEDFRVLMELMVTSGGTVPELSDLSTKFIKG